MSTPSAVAHTIWPTRRAAVAGGGLLALVSFLATLSQMGVIGWRADAFWVLVPFAQAAALTLLFLVLPGWYSGRRHALATNAGLLILAAGLLAWTFGLLISFVQIGPMPPVFWIVVQPNIYAALIAVGSVMVASGLWRTGKMRFTTACALASTGFLAMVIIGGRGWVQMVTNAPVSLPETGLAASIVSIAWGIAWVLAGQSDGTRPYVDQSRGLTPELPAPRQARALPGVVQTCAAAVCLVLVLVGPGLHVLNAALGARPVYPWFATDASGSIAYFAVGGLIVSRRLENPIGWLLCAVGLLASLDLASSEYAITSQLGTHGLPPGSQWAEWLSTWVWVAESFPPVFLLLLFPDGRLPAGRMFRATAVLLAIGAGVAVVIMATQPGPMSATPGVIDLMNPLGILVPNSAREPLLMMCFWLWFAGTLLSILVLVDRYIGSRDIQRQQIKWIALGAAITTPVLLAINYPLYDLIRANVTGQIVVCIAQAVFPVTVGVAIFRYRLYSIDLIINRAAVYTILTFVLGSGFLAVTALSQKALQLTTGQQSDVVPVALGIGTAFVFQPARRRAQFLVDRVLPAREQRALFFTDIVGSTEHLARIGDGAWRDLLERYRAVVRRELKRHGGAEMHIAGDSFFATFSDPLRAVRCAQSLAPALRTLGLESRFGVHWGPCEVRGEEVSGLSVWAAARVMSAAGPSEIMISEPVLEALGPKQVPVEDRGTHQLKGLPGDWHLHALAEQASGATS